MMGELFSFALVVFLGQFSPGPDMILLTRTALAEGRKAGYWMVLGIVSGLSFHAALAIGAMAALFSFIENAASGAGLLRGLHWLAAAYLTWLAFGLLRKKTRSDEPGLSGRSPYFRGLFCNLLNPKVLIFFASVVAPFMAGSRPDWWPFALGLLIVGEGLVFWTLWVCFLQNPRIRNGYLRLGRTIDLVFALLLFGLALHLLR